LVRAQPDPPDYIVDGGLAQLGEHLLCKQGVVGSIPSSSTILDVANKRHGKKSEASVWQLNACFWFFNWNCSLTKWKK
jgi:hypothetical protein